MSDRQDELLIEYDSDEMPYLDGVVYEQRGDRHFVQFHSGKITYEFEVRDEEVAAGFRGIGSEILSEMGSGLQDLSLSPSEVKNDE